VFTREVLLEQVWGYRHAADTRLVNVPRAAACGAKVERDPETPDVVLTVRGRRVQSRPALKHDPALTNDNGDDAAASVARA